MGNSVNTAILPPTAGADAFLAKPPQIRDLDSRDLQAPKDNKKFDQVFQDYEAVYLSQMLSHMYEGVEPDPMFGGGQAEETMRSLLLNEYGKMMAQRGGIGLADAMKKQMLQVQEQAAQQQAAAAIAPAADGE